MKRLFVIMIVGVLLLGLSGAANADSFPVFSRGFNDGTTIYDGEYSGNDNGITSIDGLVVGSGLYFLGKVEFPNTIDIENPGNGLEVFYDAGNKSGTWTSSKFTVDFITIKAGDGFVVYNVNSPEYISEYGSNGWSTALLGGKEVSHISFWGKNNSAVPVPAAVWLFGSGIVGLVGVRRKIRK